MSENPELMSAPENTPTGTTVDSVAIQTRNEAQLPSAARVSAGEIVHQNREQPEGSEGIYTSQALAEVRNSLATIGSSEGKSNFTKQEDGQGEEETLTFLQEHPSVLPEGVILEQLTPQQRQVVIKQTAFARLRYASHEANVRDTRHRGTTDPQPTEIELRMGAYKETLEPQIREAAQVLYRKGYKTNNSGFGGYAAEKQMLGGYFTLTKGAIKALQGLDLGIEVTTHNGHTHIEFLPAIADLHQITTTWNSIASVLPDKGHPAEPDRSTAAVLFRTIHSHIDLTAYPEQQQALEMFRQRPELLAYLELPREFAPQENILAHTLVTKIMEIMPKERKYIEQSFSYAQDRGNLWELLKMLYHRFFE